MFWSSFWLEHCELTRLRRPSDLVLLPLCVRDWGLHKSVRVGVGVGVWLRVSWTPLANSINSSGPSSALKNPHPLQFYSLLRFYSFLSMPQMFPAVVAPPSCPPVALLIPPISLIFPHLPHPPPFRSWASSSSSSSLSSSSRLPGARSGTALRSCSGRHLDRACVLRGVRCSGDVPRVRHPPGRRAGNGPEAA